MAGIVDQDGAHLLLLIRHSDDTHLTVDRTVGNSFWIFKVGDRKSTSMDKPVVPQLNLTLRRRVLRGF